MCTTHADDIPLEMCLQCAKQQVLFIKMLLEGSMYRTKVSWGLPQAAGEITSKLMLLHVVADQGLKALSRSLQETLHTGQFTFLHV